MSLLAELGLDPNQGRFMLIAPPDHVLAEAGAMKPRPSIASTLQVGEPTARIAWWPERRLLSPATLSRFAWMLSNPGSSGWLVIDPEEDEALSEAEVREALPGSGLAAGESVTLSSGEVALPVAAER